MEVHLISGSLFPDPEASQAPIASSLYRCPLRVCGSQDDTWCAPTGKRMLPYPCPRDAVGGLPPPGFLSPGPLPPPFFLRCLLGHFPCPLRRILGSPLFLRPVYLGTDAAVDCLERLTGGLFPSARLGGTARGAHFGLGGARSRGDGGQESYLPGAGFLSLPWTPLEEPGFFGGRFGCSGLLTGYLFGSGMASRRGGKPGCQVAFFGGQKTVPRDKRPAWTLPKVETGTTSVKPGPFSVRGPRPGSPGPLVVFSTCVFCFPPGAPGFCQGPPVGGATGEGGFFAGTFGAENTPPL
ncbi:hypothetical protein GWK47_030048 [Chionoecetes opilio]|uniref:Uncharacterized protein n=1 Tax=Chionoecetes opilio TaxID=41210 RepID=A0A8J4YKA1_CHIOP|nr:hypothetical protein GWK47_030048 [Chionoecetes opilio]